VVTIKLEHTQTVSKHIEDNTVLFSLQNMNVTA